ncbi:MAG: hypothetical protein WC647_15365 [Desulfomonilaceae bacterium]|jgi:hypothetical protein
MKKIVVPMSALIFAFASFGFAADTPSPADVTKMESHKKYIWGVPAGTALKKDVSIPVDETLKDYQEPVVQPPHSMKFKWGVDAD